MHADLDALLTALYVLVDDFLPHAARAWPSAEDLRRRADLPGGRAGAARPSLASAASCAWPSCRLGHLFPYIPGSRAINKRLRALAPQIVRRWRRSPAGRSRRVRPAQAARLDAGPVRRLARDRHAAPRWPASPATATAPPTAATSGASASTCSAPPTGCRRVRARPRQRTRTRRRRRTARPSAQPGGTTVIADKGFAGAEFEQLVLDLGGRLHPPRPQRRTATASAPSAASANGSKSIIDALKDQLSLERHGARTLPGLISRIAQRLLALTAALFHNWPNRPPPRPQPHRLRPLGINHLVEDVRDQHADGDRHGHRDDPHEQVGAAAPAPVDAPVAGSPASAGRCAAA